MKDKRMKCYPIRSLDLVTEEIEKLKEIAKRFGFTHLEFEWDNFLGPYLVIDVNEE